MANRERFIFRVSGVEWILKGILRLQVENKKKTKFMKQIQKFWAAVE